MKTLDTGSLARSLVFALALAHSAFAAATPTSYAVLGDSSKVKFLAIGRPSLLKINGEGSAPKGQVKIDGAKATGSFEFDLDSLKTGIDLRDSHMKEKYLQTAQFKDAKLTIDSLSLPAGWDPNKPALADQPFEGKLLLHGVEKPVKGTFKVEGGNAAQLPVAAEFQIKLTDYAIDIPSYAGIKVADDVKVQVAMTLAKETTSVPPKGPAGAAPAPKSAK